MNYERTADNSIYLNENRYSEPKESFKQIAALLDLANASGRLLDIGCATGEFLFFVRSLNKDMDLQGVEYSPQMVEHGGNQLEQARITITEGDANSLPLDSESFDFVTTIGVTSIFDDFRPSFNEMIRVARDGGECLNHMLVNEEQMDVIVRYLNREGQLEAGWNRHSIATITEFLKSHPDVADFEFVKHEMPFDIPQRDDPMRSWTKIVDGQRILWNGLGAEVSLYHIRFRISKR